MYTHPCREAQAAIVVAQAKDYHFDWRLPQNDENSYFLKNPRAAYMLRLWRESDDPNGFQFANLLDMDGITIVFRAGARHSRWYATRGRMAWKRAQSYAEYILAECPELGVDGDRPLPRLHA